MKKMLINARQAEETRIAIVEDNQLMDLDIESVDREQKKANIYKAKISHIEPSLNAIFVNYGEEKNGFLPYKEISPEYFKKTPQDANTPLNELLDVGQELIVQIAKEERGNKGAALTTFITLAGCYMVLMSNNPSAGGISRRIEGEGRQKLKALFDSISIPESMGVIIRTAGVDRSADEIQADLDTLVNLWGAIKRVSYQRRAPFLIHKESDITIRAIRDHLKEDISEIIIDEESAHQDLKRQLSMLRPHFVERLQLYKKDLPLFNAHHIEKQIESAYRREITLPSGGSIVIDTTEALTAIDINSARATKGDNIEETALATNLEAAVEIARQLRLRDLGGLIVVDFIDMSFFPNQKSVEQKLVDALFHDRAKIQMTKISRFGLVEISRQRLQASLGESVMHACPRCQGHGFIRSIPSLALSILRNIRAETLRDKTNEIRVQLPLDVATFLLNEKRDELHQIEESAKVKVLLIPNANLQSPHFSIQRIWGDNYNASRASIDLIEKEKDVKIYKSAKQDKSKQPALKTAHQAQSARPTNINDKTPTTEKAKKQQKPTTQKKGLWAKLVAFFFEDNAQEVKKQEINKGKRRPEQYKSQQQQNRNKKPNSTTRQKPQGTSHPRSAKDNDRPRQSSNNRNQRRNSERHGNKGGNRNTRSNQRLQVHQSEELVDIATLKKESPGVKKAAKEKAIMKTISTTPEEKISLMVKEVLSQANTLSNTDSAQVETSTKQTSKTKYLEFEVVTFDHTKAKQTPTESSGQQATENSAQSDAHKNQSSVDVIVEDTSTAKSTEKSETQNKVNDSTHGSNANNAQADSKTKDKKPKTRRTKKTPHIDYSPAVDVNAQGYVAKSNSQK